VSTFYSDQDLNNIFPPGLTWLPDDLEEKRYSSSFYDKSVTGSKKRNIFDTYIETLGRRCGCCRNNGTFPDKKNEMKTLKPHFVNEMSMMSFYRQMHPDRIHYLPVLPPAKFITNRWIGDMGKWASPHGSMIAGPTLDGVWDPNSWGQRLGGTDRGKDDTGFTDPAHIIAQGIMVTNCRVRMRCSNRMSKKWMNSDPAETGAIQASTFVDDATGQTNTTCWTQPLVSCGDENRGKWWPIWNLHVHSKLSSQFVSKHCRCERRPHPHKVEFLAGGVSDLVAAAAAAAAAVAAVAPAPARKRV